MVLMVAGRYERAAIALGKALDVPLPDEAFIPREAVQEWTRGLYPIPSGPPRGSPAGGRSSDGHRRGSGRLPQLAGGSGRIRLRPTQADPAGSARRFRASTDLDGGALRTNAHRLWAFRTVCRFRRNRPRRKQPTGLHAMTSASARRRSDRLHAGRRDRRPSAVRGSG